MDRLIATNSVNLAGADTAPVTGTPQYATSGNPATNTPATVYPAYAFNAMQDEVMNVILGAGLTPNRNAWNQLITAILSLSQTQNGTAFTTAGAAPNFTLTPVPALTALAANQRFRVKFNAAGTTGSNTLNISGLGAVALMQFDSNGNLQPAIVPSGLLSDVEYNGTYCVVLDPVSPKMSVVGSMRSLKMYISAASASATLTADEIIVETALGGMAYQLSSFNKTINLAMTGAGGMDTGSAPVSGYVGIYAIYNPTTATAALLATNAASLVGNVYGGANMPSGYTASALISVWPTNASSQLKTGLQIDRDIGITLATAYSTSSVVGTPSGVSITTIVPVNARAIMGELSVASTVASSLALSVSADALGTSQQNVTLNSSSGAANYRMLLQQPQAFYFSSASSAGTPTFIVYITGYSI
jgi:hypothetical protein